MNKSIVTKQKLTPSGIIQQKFMKSGGSIYEVVEKRDVLNRPFYVRKHRNHAEESVEVEKKHKDKVKIKDITKSLVGHGVATF